MNDEFPYPGGSSYPQDDAIDSPKARISGGQSRALRTQRVRRTRSTLPMR